MVVNKNMSKRVLGIGIIATGLLVLSVALIIGLEFPKAVYSKLLEDVCILRKEHPKFDIWVHDSYRTKYNRVYYWTLQNKQEFLYGFETPRVLQKGPYVYRETEVKIDVRYGYKSIEFKTWLRQTFEAGMTRRECGQECGQNDMITTINPTYLDKVGHLGGDDAYSLYRTPSTLKDTLDRVTSLHGDPAGILHTMALLGRLSGPSLDQWRRQLQLPSGFSDFSFASWLSLNDTEGKQTVLDHRNGSDFSDVEMMGLYEALTNPDIFNASKAALTNVTFQKHCKVFSSLSSGVSYRSFNPVWTVWSPSQPTTPAPLPPPSRKPPVASSDTIPSNQCGLVVCIQRFRQYETSDLQTKMYNISTVIAQYLCTNSNTSCFALPERPLPVRYAYLNVIYEYIFHHIVRYVFYQNVILTGNVLVTTRKQSELALGYYMTNSSSTSSHNAHAQTEFVPGVLDNAQDITSARERSKQIVMYNCYDAVEASTNFMWKAYDHRIRASEEQFPAVPKNERLIKGYHLNVPPMQNISACVIYQLQHSSYGFFYAPFWRRLNFSVDDNLYTSLGGVRLKRLSFNETTNLAVDNKFIVERGLQSMTGTNGYLSWISLPHFLFADARISEQFGMRPRSDAHRPYLDVQPVSGVTWRDRFSYQLSVGLKPEYFSMSTSLRVNYTDRPIPVYWVERTSSYTQAGLDDYNHRITGLLVASCGGLVGLSIVAAMVIITGLLAATITVRDGRVAPIEMEEVSLY